MALIDSHEARGDGRAARVRQAPLPPGLGATRVTIILGAQGRVAAAEAGVEDVLGDGFRVSQGRLRASAAAVDQRLQALIAGAVREVNPTAGALSVPRRAAPPIVVRASPLADATPNLAAILTVTIAGDFQPPETALLRDAFGLTPQEARLARHVGEGGGLVRAADRIGVSVQTARSHLKAVFCKTQTHSQAELAVLLRSCSA